MGTEPAACCSKPKNGPRRRLPHTPHPKPGKASVTFQTPDGLELRGMPVRITRHHVVFEVFNPSAFPQLSEALQNFQIVLQGRVIYSGQAVVRNLVDAGGQIVGEATLKEAQWTDLNQVLALQKEGQITREFKAFLKDWQKFYTVSPEFKIVIADMQTFLHDLRLWLEQLELGIRALPANRQKEFEQTSSLEDRASWWFRPLTRCLKGWRPFPESIGEELRPPTRFRQRQLHSLVMGSPFAYRTFEKPLGYAGDYEMVNMIAPQPLRGQLAVR